MEISTHRVGIALLATTLLVIASIAVASWVRADRAYRAATVHVRDGVEAVTTAYGSPPCTPDGCFSTEQRAECWCGVATYRKDLTSTEKWYAVNTPETRRGLEEDPADVCASLDSESGLITVSQNYITHRTGERRQEEVDGTFTLRGKGNNAAKHCASVHTVTTEGSGANALSFRDGLGTERVRYTYTVDRAGASIVMNVGADPNSAQALGEYYTVLPRVHSQLTDSDETYVATRLLQTTVSTTGGVSATAWGFRCTASSATVEASENGGGVSVTIDCGRTDLCEYDNPNLVTCTLGARRRNARPTLTLVVAMDVL